MAPEKEIIFHQPTLPMDDLKVKLGVSLEYITNVQFSKFVSSVYVESIIENTYLKSDVIWEKENAKVGALLFTISLRKRKGGGLQMSSPSTSALPLNLIMKTRKESPPLKICSTELDLLDLVETMLESGATAFTRKLDFGKRISAALLITLDILDRNALTVDPILKEAITISSKKKGNDFQARMPGDRRHVRFENMQNDATDGVHQFDHSHPVGCCENQSSIETSSEIATPNRPRGKPDESTVHVPVKRLNAAHENKVQHLSNENLFVVKDPVQKQKQKNKFENEKYVFDLLQFKNQLDIEKRENEKLQEETNEKLKSAQAELRRMNRAYTNAVKHKESYCKDPAIGFPLSFQDKKNELGEAMAILYEDTIKGEYKKLLQKRCQRRKALVNEGDQIVSSALDILRNIGSGTTDSELPLVTTEPYLLYECPEVRRGIDSLSKRLEELREDLQEKNVTVQLQAELLKCEGRQLNEQLHRYIEIYEKSKDTEMLSKDYAEAVCELTAVRELENCRVASRPELRQIMKRGLQLERSLRDLQIVFNIIGGNIDVSSGDKGKGGGVSEVDRDNVNLHSLEVKQIIKRTAKRIQQGQ